MATQETYAQRSEKLRRAGEPDVYQYDFLPDTFRNQVFHIWLGAVGRPQEPPTSFHPPDPAEQYWRDVFMTFLRETGLPTLVDPARHRTYFDQCAEYLQVAETEQTLSLIEWTFSRIEQWQRTHPVTQFRALQNDGVALRPGEAEMVAAYRNWQSAEDAVQELNRRFKQHGLGYQFIGGRIFRQDSEFVHEQVVTPAIALLQSAGFRGASEEFMRAHEHLRQSRTKEAVATALQSFESTMKAICAARNWSHPANATAKPLIDIMFAQGLMPEEMASHFAGLRSALESGIPTLSNKTSRHGQGAKVKSVPDYLAAYALHLTAANIVLLVEAHKAKK